MRRILVALLVTIALVGPVACSGGGDDSASDRGDVDPMVAVNESVRFSSDGVDREGWSWLDQPDQQARWEFSGLPAELTDLVLQFAAKVPEEDTVADAYLSFGTPESSDPVGVAQLKVPVTAPGGARAPVASTTITIPREAVPEGATELWIAAGRTAGAQPALGEPVGVREGSVRFSSLRIDPSDEEPVPEDVSPPDTDVLDGDEPVLPTPGSTTTTSPATEGGRTFTSTGDSISGWYWLRDPAGMDEGMWTMPVPRTGALWFDLEVLATSGIDGPPGVRARFWLGWGPVVDGQPGTSGRQRLVTLRNTSAADDPVGYTNTGSVTLAAVPQGTQRIWVRIRRADDGGAQVVPEHIAVREASIRIHDPNATTTTNPPSTIAPGTTTTSPASTTTSAPPTSSTTTPADTTVASCAEGGAEAAEFAPVESAARWYTADDGRRLYVMRGTGGVVDRQMPEDVTEWINYHATWTFRNLPAGEGDVRIRFTSAWFKDSSVSNSPLPSHELYVTYGRSPAPAEGRVLGPETVTLTPISLPPIMLPTGAEPNSTVQVYDTYRAYRGEITLPREAVDGSAGFWVRASLYDLDARDRWGAQVALNRTSIEMCTGTRPKVPVPDQPSTPDVTVTVDPADRTVTTNEPFLVPPGDDPDGDGLNQTFEDAAAAALQPVLEFDEMEDSATYRDQIPMGMMVHVRPWPSYRDVKYVFFEYLATYALDGGAGLTVADWNGDWGRIGVEAHRGDSEKVYLAYQVVDDTHLSLAQVYTSAHDDGTMHNARWDPVAWTCNTTNVTEIDVSALTKEVVTEQLCGSLEFDDTGRVLVFPSRNKHAAYPSKSTCQSATLVRVAGLENFLGVVVWLVLPDQSIAVFTETCGYDPWFDDDFSADPRYEGDGRWTLDLFDVGEPGNWLVDDLAAPATWRQLTDAQITALTGMFPNEHVWTGRVDAAAESNTAFCGGLDPTMGGYEYPDACSGRLGAKYDHPPPGHARRPPARRRLTRGRRPA